MAGIQRVVVFTGEMTHSVRKGIVVIDGAVHGLAWLIIAHVPRRKFPEIFHTQWRNFRRHGFRRIPDVASAIRDRLRKERPSAAKGSPGVEYLIDQLLELPNVQMRQFQDIHAAAVIEQLKSFSPDIGISLAAPILRATLFSIPKLGTLNLHEGKLPEYRGMPPAFWELWNNEETVGCTIHWINEGLDTGPIAADTSIDCEKYSTVKGLQLRLDEVGINLMRDVVVKLARGFHLSTPQSGGGKTYRQPTMAQVARLRHKISRLLPPPRQALTKTLLKEVIKKSISTIGILGLHRIIRPRATVLLYHRITDSARDELTTGIEQFDRHTMLLRRHFRVISLLELLQMNIIPRSDRPFVCVTFDDGYLDNYLNAFPILLRNQIPATFFVSTGHIGNDRQFPHDTRKGNSRIQSMNWHHLREMLAAGFTIGSHTVNHIDCAAEPEDTVLNELLQSRQTITRELGLQQILFSYPYGGRQHMTPERLKIVQQAGYIGCVSAYGGSNIDKIDCYNIVRRGIHCEFSDASFLYTALGLW